MEDEIEPLLSQGDGSSGGDTDTSSGRKKKNVFCIIVFIIGVAALTAAIVISYFLYFKYVIGEIKWFISLQSNSFLGLKVLALNVWGMPAKVGSEDKELRMKAIGKFIQKQEYDVYLLAELWMRPDHETIRQHVPEGYYMTEVGDFALSTCDGRALPSFCSGLAIVSRFPFIEVNKDHFIIRNFLNHCFRKSFLSIPTTAVSGTLMENTGRGR